MASEHAVRQAYQLYELRRAAHLFYGPRYAEHAAHMQEVLKRVQKQQRMDNVLIAAVWLGQRVDQGDFRELALIMAAAVDLLEPELQSGKTEKP